MYKDRWIEFTSTGLRVRAYYFPWGTKRIEYSAIRSVRRVELGAFTGKARIWGTANPRYWASLDPARPRKQFGFVFDLGGVIQPFVTPDDPDAFERELSAHISVDDGGHGPIV